jgi:hypothetical protein
MPMLVHNVAGFTMFVLIGRHCPRCMLPPGAVILLADAEVAADSAWRTEIDILREHGFAEVIEGVGPREAGTLH